MNVLAWWIDFLHGTSRRHEEDQLPDDPLLSERAARFELG